MIQPGCQLMRDLLGQLFDRLACIEDVPALRFLRDQLLVAGRDLLMVGQLARVEPVPFDCWVARGSRGEGEQRSRGDTGSISATSRLLVSLSPCLLIGLALAAFALQPLVGSYVEIN